jgi:hypothetical protein
MQRLQQIDNQTSLSTNDSFKVKNNGNSISNKDS